MKHAHATLTSASATTGTFSGAKAFAADLAGLPRQIIATLIEWQARTDGRQHLRELDDRLLADMGISRSDAYRESRKWFWQA